MTLKLLKSKLHLATVTGADLYYDGSLTVSPELIEAAGLLPYEVVLVSNVATGARAETYVIPGHGVGRIELNGAMARLGATGDRLIVMAFALVDRETAARHRPIVAKLDERNRIID